MSGHDDNIFDDDDVMDLMLLEEFEQENKGDRGGNGNGGCLGMILLMLVPGGMLAFLLRSVNFS